MTGAITITADVAESVRVDLRSAIVSATDLLAAANSGSDIGEQLDQVVAIICAMRRAERELGGEVTS